MERTVKAFYLLPCECGNEVSVTLAQAGQTVSCSCGRSLSVPTMLGIKALELAEPESDWPISKSEWGARQRVILVGLVLVLASVAVLAFFHRGEPEPPAKILETDLLERHTESLSLIQTMQLWDYLRQGFSTKREVDIYYERLLAAYHRRMGITLVFLGLGILTLLGGFFIRKPPREDDEVDETESTDSVTPPE